MLTHLTINHFMLIDHLDLDLKKGMTTITGETGTGKSIFLDALGLALGDRADGDRVRQGREKADITATFLLDDLPDARQWLIEHDLSHADECLLRRVVTKEGRSRAYINGQPVPLGQLRLLAELLIDIHSQHAHQSLLSKASHIRILDEFAQHMPLAKEVRIQFQHWQALKNQFIQLRDNADEMNARYQLLQYQVEEFELLDLEFDELDKLEAEQQVLANAESLLSKSHQLAECCDNDEQGIRQQLHTALSLLQSINPQTEHLSVSAELLNNALIQVEEAHSSIRQQIDQTQLDPERLQQVEDRLSAIYTLARKHHINPSEIHDKYSDLKQEFDSLQGGDEALGRLETEMNNAEQAFTNSAETLSTQRKVAAEQLTLGINQQLEQLAMGGAHFVVQQDQTTQPTLHGIDDIEFLISTNPGQAPKSLAKVASGGELSRISLAIQVTTAQTSRVASLVFDEVDVGIGGRTADTVGKLLSQLGEQCQVLCITHLAQVASKGDQHWQVSKFVDAESASSTIIELNKTQKIEEIARMISGDELSEQSLAHAREMVG